MVKPASKHRRPQVDAATVEIFINDAFQGFNGGLPDRQRANIWTWLDKPMQRWLEPVLRQRLRRSVHQPAMFQLRKDVDEFAAGEAAKQQTIIVAFIDGERR